MRTFVWVASWQQQCCGDNFRVGSVVVWTVHPVRGDWVGSLLGPQWGTAVQYQEEHHGAGDELGPSKTLHGVVRSIQVVTSELEARPDPHYPGLTYPDVVAPATVMFAVAGSGRLREVEAADPWEAEPSEEHAHESFDGWVVEVDVTRVV